MAKKSMIAREYKRQKMTEKYAKVRLELKETMYDQNLSMEERAKARVKFYSLPRDTSPARLHNRCRLTGRPRGYFRKFGLCRNKLREFAMRGEIPGVRKASW
jgi:small subunit ribosomal protein S14